MADLIRLPPAVRSSQFGWFALTQASWLPCTAVPLWYGAITIPGWAARIAPRNRWYLAPATITS
jgi:hypothetical protein